MVPASQKEAPHVAADSSSGEGKGKKGGDERKDDGEGRAVREEEEGCEKLGPLAAAAIGEKEVACVAAAWELVVAASTSLPTVR